MSRTSTNVPDRNLLVSDSFSERTIKNFSAVKGVAALIVMLGHYASIPNFWVGSGYGVPADLYDFIRLLHLATLATNVRRDSL